MCFALVSLATRSFAGWLKCTILDVLLIDESLKKTVNRRRYWT